MYTWRGRSFFELWIRLEAEINKIYMNILYVLYVVRCVFVFKYERRWRMCKYSSCI